MGDLPRYRTIQSLTESVSCFLNLLTGGMGGTGTDTFYLIQLKSIPWIRTKSSSAGFRKTAIQLGLPLGSTGPRFLLQQISTGFIDSIATTNHVSHRCRTLVFAKPHSSVERSTSLPRILYLQRRFPLLRPLSSPANTFRR